MYFPRESYYQLIIHMSDVYHLLSIGSYYLEKWNESFFSFREVLTIRCLDSFNYLDEKIVDFSRAKRDLFIYELANYYIMYYWKRDIMEEIHLFFHNFSVIDAEKYLFYSLISIVPDIDYEKFNQERNELIQKQQEELKAKQKKNKSKKKKKEETK